MNKLNITGNTFPLTVENLKLLQEQNIFLSQILSSFFENNTYMLYVIYYDSPLETTPLGAVYGGEFFPIPANRTNVGEKGQCWIVEKNETIKTDNEQFTNIRTFRYVVFDSKQEGETTLRTFNVNTQIQHVSICQKLKQIETTANSAREAAATAQSTANSAQSTADSAQSTAATAQSTADSAQTEIAAIQTTVKNNTTRINLYRDDLLLFATLIANTNNIICCQKDKVDYVLYGGKSYYCFQTQSDIPIGSPGDTIQRNVYIVKDKEGYDCCILSNSAVNNTGEYTIQKRINNQTFVFYYPELQIQTQNHISYPIVLTDASNPSFPIGSYIGKIDIYIGEVVELQITLKVKWEVKEVSLYDTELTFNYGSENIDLLTVEESYASTSFITHKDDILDLLLRINGPSFGQIEDKSLIAEIFKYVFSHKSLHLEINKVKPPLQQ